MPRVADDRGVDLAVAHELLGGRAVGGPVTSRPSVAGDHATARPRSRRPASPAVSRAEDAADSTTPATREQTGSPVEMRNALLRSFDPISRSATSRTLCGEAQRARCAVRGGAHRMTSLKIWASDGMLRREADDRRRGRRPRAAPLARLRIVGVEHGAAAVELERP